MSSSQDFPADNRRSCDKAPEKSNFAQTCNRLRQYLKEKGSVRDLGLEIASKLENRGRLETPHFTSTATNLLPAMENSDMSAPQYEFMDLFPQQAKVDGPMDHIQLDDADNTTSSKSATVETEPKATQMTIFYGGRVLVFDNFPADKAGELFHFAGKESCSNSEGFLSTSITGAKNIKSGDSDMPNPGTNLRLRPQTQAISGSDYPFMRTPSLDRFVEKRKDRIKAKSPYQVHGSVSTSSPKCEEDLDLNF